MFPTVKLLRVEIYTLEYYIHHDVGNESHFGVFIVSF